MSSSLSIEEQQQRTERVHPVRSVANFRHGSNHNNDDTNADEGGVDNPNRSCSSSRIRESRRLRAVPSNIGNGTRSTSRRSWPEQRNRCKRIRLMWPIGRSSHFLPIAVMTLAVTAFTSPGATAWNVHSSLSNATATYHAARKEFHVYLIPEEILDFIHLQKFNCSVADEQAYITRSGGNATSTLLQWNNHAPAESDNFSVALDCSKPDEDDISRPNHLTAAAPGGGDGSDQASAGHEKSANTNILDESAREKSAASKTSGSTSTVSDSASTTSAKAENTAEAGARRKRDVAANAPSTAEPAREETTKASTGLPADSSSSFAHPGAEASTGVPSSTPPSDAQPIPAISKAGDIKKNDSKPPTTDESRTTPTALSSTSTPQPGTLQGHVSTPMPIVNPTSAPASLPKDNGQTSAHAGNSTIGAEQRGTTSNSETTELPPNRFRLVIIRLTIEFVQAQTLNSLEDVQNITGDMNSLLIHGNESRCAILPKDVRSVDRRYVLLAVAETSSGDVVRAGDMYSACGQEGWQDASRLLPDPSRVRMLNSRNFQLQILCVTLAAAVVVFALLAVFLCTKWRLAVRRFRRDASDGFHVKTFHTKEHHYKPDDDDPYGFPTIPRDSTFYRGTDDVRSRASGRCGGASAAHSSVGRSSFVNGGFHEESSEGLPPPPPELRACLIDDSHFTNVPLHNLGSDSLGRVPAHRGVRTSAPVPPVPPVRTISSGYNTTSGQSSPASPCTSPLSPVSPEYHRPHEVLAMMPPIPKEDYSDSDDDDSSASTGAQRNGHQGSHGGQQEKEQREGRFTVRTVL